MSSWKPYTKEDMWTVIQNGGFCCLLNKDKYDEVWGKWLEWGYETEDEYIRIKNQSMTNGLWEKYVLENLISQ